MEPQQIINTILGLLVGLLAWLGREVWSSIQDVKRTLGGMQRELPEKYVQKSDLKDSLGELRDLLHRIWDRLEQKADKP